MKKSTALVGIGSCLNHYTMFSKKTCNIPNVFGGGIIVLLVLNLMMSYMVWRDQHAEQRFRLEKFKRDFDIARQSAEELIEEIIDAAGNIPGTQTSKPVSNISKKKTSGKTKVSRPHNVPIDLDPAKEKHKNVTRNSEQHNTAQLKNDSINVQSPLKKKQKLQKIIKGVKKPKKATKPEHRGINTTEVQRIRQHVLKFYNPDTNLTLTQSRLHTGQHLKYELRAKNVFNITDDFLQLIPMTSPLKDRHFTTCAVVGNSGIVLNSNCGQQIDSMDFVMRCNLPPIEGYEKDVGSKANFTTMNPSVIPFNVRKGNKTKDEYNRLLERLKLVGDQILYVPAFTSAFGEKYVRLISRMVLRHKLSTTIAFAPAGTNNLMKSIWREFGFGVLRPSTGMHMYTLAATICDQIHMYGFYPFKKDTHGRALRYHYYDRSRMIKNTTHNMPEEFRALQQLHQRGALVLHTEPCQ